MLAPGFIRQFVVVLTSPQGQHNQGCGGYLLYRCTLGGEGAGICALFHKLAGRMGAVYDLEIGASRTQ
jgi:hypothetical protein